MSYVTSVNRDRSEYWGPTVWSVLLHAAALVALIFNYDLFSTDQPFITAKVIDAVVVDSSVLDVLDKEKQRKEQQKKQQKKQQQLQAEKKRQQEVERIKKEKLEQQRLLKQKELEEKKKLEEQKRLQEQERLEEERRLLEQAQQEEWEKIKAEEQAAAEQARSRELATNMDLYKLAIKQRVDRNWVRPLSVEDWYTCEVMVDQIPGGEVINVQILQCDGDAVFQRSVRNAVYKSSPLPDPQNPTLFDRRLKFTFRVPKE